MTTIEPSIQHLDFEPEPAAPKVHYIAPGEWGDEDYLANRVIEHSQRHIAAVMGLPYEMVLPEWPQPLPFQRLGYHQDQAYSYCSPHRSELWNYPHPAIRRRPLRNWIARVAGFFVG